MIKVEPSQGTEEELDLASPNGSWSSGRSGDSFGGCGGCVDGGVVGVQDEFGVHLVEDHTGGVLAGLFGSRWWRWWCVRLRMSYYKEMNR